MDDNDLGPIPEPYAEEPQLVPGGADADALHSDPADDGLPRDLGTEENPAVDDTVPDEISEPDDKSQAPEGEADDQESGTTAEDAPEAGQEAEDGSPEPPA